LSESPLDHSFGAVGKEAGVSLRSLRSRLCDVVSFAAIERGLQSSARPRVQLLAVEGLLHGMQRAEHPDYEPDSNFKRAKAEQEGEQQPLI
jgi:hypothetical protein